MNRQTSVQIIQQRRKWSDWSVCSSGCVRTRHRLNCDDLVAEQKRNEAKETFKIIKRQVNGREHANETELRRGEEELLSGDQQVDEEDYADEGDDDDAKDNCANVDPAKTFQERPCLGGRCRLSPRAEQGRISQPKKVFPDETNVNATRVDNKQVPRNGSNSEGSPRTLLPKPATATSTAMWPQQLLNGDLGPQANLLQWSILIGSLLTIILLIMLILRKLFASAVPSYHWMLAKQTLKSSANVKLATNCCAHRLQPAAHPTANQLLVSDGSTTATSRLQPPPHHHMYYAWPPSQNPTADTCALPAGYQFVVDASGQQHLLMEGTNSLTFNTDHHHLTGSSSCSSSCKQRAKTADQHSLLSNYLCNTTYDTLNGTQRHSVDDKSFSSSVAAARFSSATNTNHNLDPLTTCKHSSPNVPPESDTATNQRTSKLNSQSRSPSVASSDSCSVQSTTAQMLSNAASSSFEQPPDLVADYPAVKSGTTHSTALVQSNAASLSATASPISQQAAKLRPTNGKLVGVPTAVQSQPNSPMFANQFSAASGRTGRKKVVTGAVRAPKLVTRRNHLTTSGQDELKAEAGAANSHHLNSTSQVAQANSQKCDTAEAERHFYEEINHTSS